MICKFCGNEIDNNSDFCFICGQKVEAQAPVYTADNANVYSQAAQNVAPMDVEAPAEEAAPAPAPVQPTAQYAQQAPAPMYQQPPMQYPAQPMSKKQMKKQAKAAKKADKKAAKQAKKDATLVSKGKKFLYIFIVLIGQLIGLANYKKAKKAGDTELAVQTLNSFMTGVCVWLAAIDIGLAFVFFK